MYLIFALIFCCSCSPPGDKYPSKRETIAPDIKTLAVSDLYDFLDNLDQAVISSKRSRGDNVIRSKFSINNQERMVLLEHPNTMVTFQKIFIHAGAQLKFGIGIDQKIWHRKGDGVLFQVVLIREEASRSEKMIEQVLYLKYIDPKNNPADCRWYDETIDLSAYQGLRVSLRFQTKSGPGKDANYDWAGWSTPRLVWPKKIKLAAKSDHTNVILISLDTLRPDKLSAFGCMQAKQPYLDWLVKRSMQFETALAPSNWTVPSHMSLLTSLYPAQHKVLVRGKKLSAEFPTLAELLKRKKYLTAAFTDTTPYFHKNTFGFDRGFDHYNDRNLGGISNFNYKVLNFLNNHCSRQFFLFLHIFNIHGPYEPRKPYGDMLYNGSKSDPQNRSLHFVKRLKIHHYLNLSRITDVEYVRATYLGEIAEVDQELGKLFTKLQSLQIFDQSMLIVTADHGESMLDRDLYIGHGLFLYDNEIKIPLILKLPPGFSQNRIITDQVANVDVIPTVIDCLGLDVDEHFQGRSLIPLIKGMPQQDDRLYAVGEADRSGTYYIRTKKWKYITKMKDGNQFLMKHFNLKHHSEMSSLMGVPADKTPGSITMPMTGDQLYDLQNDPAEIQNLVAQKPDLAAQLASVLKKMYPTETLDHSPEEVVTFSEEEKKKLEALGYFQ
ncbi:sulfatase [candidate division CSSED10-310 bacterium]|uniref:Sulfatase n=1 Tax=candidate division CSSED10-310 bacterium TaxID=2855610 RepID=A0ABV6YWB6_UNCC1